MTKSIPDYRLHEIKAKLDGIQALYGANSLNANTLRGDMLTAKEITGLLGHGWTLIALHELLTSALQLEPK